MKESNSSRSNAREVPLIQIPSAIRFPDDTVPGVLRDRRHPIKHVLIGTPAAVQLTQHTLHVLRYADVSDWAMPLPIDEPFAIAPDSGDVISVLVRYLAIV